MSRSGRARCPAAVLGLALAMGSLSCAAPTGGGTPVPAGSVVVSPSPVAASASPSARSPSPTATAAAPRYLLVSGAGRRVELVDGDLREPRVRPLSMPDGWRLADAAAGGLLLLDGLAAGPGAILVARLEGTTVRPVWTRILADGARSGPGATLEGICLSPAGRVVVSDSISLAYGVVEASGDLRPAHGVDAQGTCQWLDEGRVIFDTSETHRLAVWEVSANTVTLTRIEAEGPSVGGGLVAATTGVAETVEVRPLRLGAPGGGLVGPAVMTLRASAGERLLAARLSADGTWLAVHGDTGPGSAAWLDLYERQGETFLRRDHRPRAADAWCLWLTDP